MRPWIGVAALVASWATCPGQAAGAAAQAADASTSVATFESTSDALAAAAEPTTDSPTDVESTSGALAAAAEPTTDAPTEVESTSGALTAAAEPTTDAPTDVESTSDTHESATDSASASDSTGEESAHWSTSGAPVEDGEWTSDAPAVEEPTSYADAEEWTTTRDPSGDGSTAGAALAGESTTGALSTSSADAGDTTEAPAVRPLPHMAPAGAPAGTTDNETPSAHSLGAQLPTPREQDINFRMLKMGVGVGETLRTSSSPLPTPSPTPAEPSGPHQDADGPDPGRVPAPPRPTPAPPTKAPAARLLPQKAPAGAHAGETDDEPPSAHGSGAQLPTPRHQDINFRMVKMEAGVGKRLRTLSSPLPTPTPLPTPAEPSGPHKDGRAAPCATVGDAGQGPGIPCVFPVVYDGKTYSQCVAINNDKKWCATRVGAKGEFLYTQWGECSPGCDDLAPGTTVPELLVQAPVSIGEEDLTPTDAEEAKFDIVRPLPARNVARELVVQAPAPASTGAQLPVAAARPSTTVALVLAGGGGAELRKLDDGARAHRAPREARKGSLAVFPISVALVALGAMVAIPMAVMGRSKRAPGFSRAPVAPEDGLEAAHLSTVEPARQALLGSTEEYQSCQLEEALE